jgi:hypothetical protein
MTDHDPNRLRWGDIYPITFPTIAEGAPAQTKQIVNARTHGLPESWTIFLYTSIDHMVPAGVSLIFTYNITIGVGASPVTFPFTFFYGPFITTNPVFSPYEIDAGTNTATGQTTLFGFTTMVLPAKDIQINANVIRNGTDFVPNMCQVGAWVAPRVSFPDTLEPHPKHPWMMSPFTPEALHYK